MINVGRSVIGVGQSPFIIAEIASNWHTLEDCLKSIEQAKRCGADAVLFHAFTFKSMYGLEKSHMPLSFSKAHELPLEWVPQLRNRADSCSIEFMCAGYDPETIRSIDPYVNVHKIDSSDIGHLELLSMAGRMKKPIFISTGGSTESAISMALAQLHGMHVVLMHCVSASPAVSVNLFVIDLLKKMSPLVGFSDYTMDSAYIPVAAIRNHGAMAIEKHFSCIGNNTPTGNMSLDERSFATMVDFITGKKPTTIGPMECERDMILKHRRRLIAIKDIKQGDRLILNENFGVFKSLVLDASAMESYMYKEVNGKKTTKQISVGAPITWLDIVN